MLKRLQQKYGIKASSLSAEAAFDLGYDLNAWRREGFGRKEINFEFRGGTLFVTGSSSAFESIVEEITTWGKGTTRYAGLEVTRVNPSGAGTEETVTIK